MIAVLKRDQSVANNLLRFPLRGPGSLFPVLTPCVYHITSINQRSTIHRKHTCWTNWPGSSGDTTSRLAKRGRVSRWLGSGYGYLRTTDGSRWRPGQAENSAAVARRNPYTSSNPCPLTTLPRNLHNTSVHAQKPPLTNQSLLNTVLPYILDHYKIRQNSQIIPQTYNTYTYGLCFCLYAAVVAAKSNH